MQQKCLLFNNFFGRSWRRGQVGYGTCNTFFFFFLSPEVNSMSKRKQVNTLRVCLPTWPVADFFFL